MILCSKCKTTESESSIQDQMQQTKVGLLQILHVLLFLQNLQHSCMQAWICVQSVYRTHCFLCYTGKYPSDKHQCQMSILQNGPTTLWFRCLYTTLWHFLYQFDADITFSVKLTSDSDIISIKLLAFLLSNKNNFILSSTVWRELVFIVFYVEEGKNTLPDT